MLLTGLDTGVTPLDPPNFYHTLLLERTIVFRRPPRASRLDTVDLMGEQRKAERPFEFFMKDGMHLAPGHLLWCVTDASTDALVVVSRPGGARAWTARDRAFPWRTTAGPPPTIESGVPLSTYSTERRISTFLSTRIREGFLLDSVTRGADDGQVEWTAIHQRPVLALCALTDNGVGTPYRRSLCTRCYR